jgi:hypothetical protein
MSHHGIPLLAMLHTSNDELRLRAGKVANRGCLLTGFLRFEASAQWSQAR